ncbi:molybdopterin-synthase adenylyltransferase MoeB [uncultured Paraglaciecola sp.]|uniref:molybdopterin-synthase adenylyltransferase MoeB n=1 Tax=uncultured Paraglaciecola sp. TaxID=1765024 RepID=UPI002612876A|nr:molybdopterin-synthase adenylyltransferase MoeB [uncultured Paraglaciecola sp.]
MSSQLTIAQAMRYNRQILLSGFDLDKQEVLCKAKVLLIGVGGLGCAASQFLAASGIGELTLVDADVVEVTNLQRQVLHAEKNVGLFKVESAISALRNINSEVKLRSRNKRQTQQQLTQLVKQHDIVLDCTDNLESRNLINKVCYEHNVPLVSGAAIRMEGQVFVINPLKKSACYGCISRYFGEQNVSCVEAGVMSPLVGIIGSMQAMEAIKTLTSYGEPLINRLQLYDAMTGVWQDFKINKSEDCLVCSTTKIR